MQLRADQATRLLAVQALALCALASAPYAAALPGQRPVITAPTASPTPGATPRPLAAPLLGAAPAPAPPPRDLPTAPMPSNASSSVPRQALPPLPAPKPSPSPKVPPSSVPQTHPLPNDKVNPQVKPLSYDLKLKQLVLLDELKQPISTNQVIPFGMAVTAQVTVTNNGLCPASRVELNLKLADSESTYQDLPVFSIPTLQPSQPWSSTKVFYPPGEGEWSITAWLKHLDFDTSNANDKSLSGPGFRVRELPPDVVVSTPQLLLEGSPCDTSKLVPGVYDVTFNITNKGTGLMPPSFASVLFQGPGMPVKAWAGVSRLLPGQSTTTITTITLPTPLQSGMKPDPTFRPTDLIIRANDAKSKAAIPESDATNNTITIHARFKNE